MHLKPIYHDVCVVQPEYLHAIIPLLIAYHRHINHTELHSIYLLCSKKTADPDALPARNRDPQAPRNRRGDIRGGCERLSGSADWRPAAQVHATAVVFHGHRSKVFTIHWISNGLWERLTVVLVYLPCSISIIIARSALHDYIILLCIYVIYIIVHIIIFW